MATALFAAPLDVPRFKSWLASGAPNAGGKVNIYVAGTSTPDTSYPTYTDALAGTNANANPVILDANGEASIFMQSGRLYKLIVTDASNVTLSGGTIDNINPAAAYPAAAAGAGFTTEWTPEFNAVSYVSATQFRVTGVDVTGVYTAGRRVRSTNSGGTIYSTVTTSIFGAGNTTVTVVNDSGSLDAGLSAVYYGANSYSNPSYLDPRTSLSVVKTATQTGFASSSQVTGWTVEVDPLGEWSVSLHRWIAKYPGKYLVVCNLVIATGAGAITAALLLKKNGATNYGPMSHAMGASSLATVSVQHVLNLIATDYIEVWLTGDANTSVGNTSNISVVRVP